MLIKVGEYNNEPVREYVCSKIGTTGQWGADPWLDESWTLGDWVARFRWIKSGVQDSEEFEWTLIRKDKPFDSTYGVNSGVKVFP